MMTFVSEAEKLLRPMCHDPVTASGKENKTSPICESRFIGYYDTGVDILFWPDKS